MLKKYSKLIDHHLKKVLIKKKILVNNLFSGFSLCLSSIRPIKKMKLLIVI